MYTDIIICIYCIHLCARVFCLTTNIQHCLNGNVWKARMQHICWRGAWRAALGGIEVRAICQDTKWPARWQIPRAAWIEPGKPPKCASIQHIDNTNQHLRHSDFDDVGILFMIFLDFSMSWDLLKPSDYIWLPLKFLRTCAGDPAHLWQRPGVSTSIHWQQTVGEEAQANDREDLNSDLGFEQLVWRGMMICQIYHPENLPKVVLLGSTINKSQYPRFWLDQGQKSFARTSAVIGSHSTPFF